MNGDSGAIVRAYVGCDGIVGVCAMMQEAVHGPVEVQTRATTFFRAFDAPVREWVVQLGSACASGSECGAVRGPSFALSDRAMRKWPMCPLKRRLCELLLPWSPWMAPSLHLTITLPHCRLSVRYVWFMRHSPLPLPVRPLALSDFPLYTNECRLTPSSCATSATPSTAARRHCVSVARRPSRPKCLFARV